MSSKKKKINRWDAHIIWLLIIIFVIFCNKMAYAVISYNKYWAPATIIGAFSKDNEWKYYFEPQLRLIDDPYVFNQWLLLAGAGYPLTDKVVFFAGPGWVVSKDPLGKLNYEKRLWQQVNWVVLNTHQANLHSRTRVEEAERNDLVQASVSFRQRFWLRLPLQVKSIYSFSCFNEVFINLNYPVWNTPSWFEQNRTFIGMAVQINPTVLLDVGYLNQYINAERKELSHVILFNFTVSL